MNIVFYRFLWKRWSEVRLTEKKIGSVRGTSSGDKLM